MPRLSLDPAAVARELAELKNKLRAAPDTLREAADVQVGVTPRSAIFARDSLRLYHYTSNNGVTGRTPLLLVYALVNRPEMLDLQAGRSVVEALIARGFDVYLLDWGEPRAVDRNRSLASYIVDYLDAAVDVLRARLGREGINLLGVCQGGTFAACYAALYPAKVERLITTVTPIDFHTPDDMLSHLVRGVDIERLIAAHGNLSGEMLNSLFLSLKPFRLLQHKYVKLIDKLDDVQAVGSFLRMEQWIFDSPMLTARAALEFGRDFYQGNRLVRGELLLGDRRVDLNQLSMPVLNLFAREDHLVPPAASRALGAVVDKASYTEQELPGGHIGIYISARSPDGVPQRLAEWFEQTKL